MLDVLIVRIVARGGFEKSSPGARRVEEEDALRLHVHQQARVPESLKVFPGADHRLAAPCPPIIRAAPYQQVNRAGQVI